MGKTQSSSAFFQCQKLRRDDIVRTAWQHAETSRNASSTELSLLVLKIKAFKIVLKFKIKNLKFNFVATKL